MKITTTFFAAVLAILPSIALAQGCNSDHDSTAAMSCTEGSSVDPETGVCVPVITG